MVDVTSLLADLAWPTTLLLAWLAGELAHQWPGLPRLSSYALVGFVLAPTQLGWLPSTASATVMLLAHLAFCLMLFDCGYRINLRWLRSNPWLAVTSLAEAGLTFGAVYLLLSGFGQEPSSVLLLSALAMASSPVTLLRVMTERHSAGQATERLLHLATLNCVSAVFVFQIILGLVLLRTSGNVWEAGFHGLVVLLASVLLGMGAGTLTPALLRWTRRSSDDSTLAFALTVVCLVALTYGLKLSPVLATLTCGLCARHWRVALNASQRGFGALGDLLAVLLFVFISSRLEWRQVLAGTGIGLAFVVVRQTAKLLGVGLFAHLSGIGWRKGLLIGLASAPTPAFVLLVLEQTRYPGGSLVEQLVPLAAATLVLETGGPLLVQRALVWAHEVPARDGG